MKKIINAATILKREGTISLIKSTKNYFTDKLLDRKRSNLVGLLYDSVYQNTGDRAIGVVMGDLMKKNHIPYEIVNPLAFDPNKYKTLIVGGGFLLRDTPDYYYDAFRVKGRHILNSMGVRTTQDLDYLNEYSYVSVRSTGDKKFLNNTVKKIRVVPDVGMALEPKKFDFYYPKKALGLHIVKATVDRCPDIVEIINSIKEVPKVYIPVTFYNEDYLLMADLYKRTDYIPVLPLLTPREIVYMISTFKFLICSSLHATMWAYINNVPFLTLWQEKVEFFLKDRGLEKWIFRNGDELKEKIPLLLNEKVNFNKPMEKDRKDIKEHFYRVKHLV